jgi:hypothetical protein
MIFTELQREVKGIILDSSPAVIASIPDFINEAVQDIAEEVSLPSLKAVFPLVTLTTTWYINTPAGFNGVLRYVGDGKREYRIIDGGLEALIRKHPDVTEVGDIMDICLEGNVFYYLPIPSVAVTLVCIGYNFPATLVNDTDSPDDIPSLYHRESIVNKAAAKAYAVIETGADEGSKTNFTLFSGLAQAGVNKISAWASRRRTNIVTSCWSV